MAFVDFSKAYDHIKRSHMWARFEELGMPATFLKVLQSLYQNVECCIRINGVYTHWFPIQFILKWFGDMKERRGLGVEVDGLMVALMLYADDLAILAESEQDLQDMLNVLHE